MKNVKQLILIFTVLGSFVWDLKIVNAQGPVLIDFGAVRAKIENDFFIQNDDFIFYTPKYSAKSIAGYVRRPEFWAKTNIGDCIIRNMKHPDFNVNMVHSSAEDNFTFPIGGSIFTNIIFQCKSNINYNVSSVPGGYGVIRKFPFGFTKQELNLLDNNQENDLWITSHPTVIEFKKHVYAAITYKRVQAQGIKDTRDQNGNIIIAAHDFQ